MHPLTYNQKTVQRLFGHSLLYMWHVTFFCLWPCTTYTEPTYSTLTCTTYVVCLWSTMCLVICYCVVIQTAPWYKHFACVHGEALLCTTSIVSMVNTMVAAVALKMKPRLKEASHTMGYQAVWLWPKTSHLCCTCMTCDTHTPGDPSVAWYWPKCILRIRWL